MRRTDRTAEEKQAVRARRKRHQAAKRVAMLAFYAPKPLTERQESRRKAKSRRQSEAARARRPQSARATRREMQRAIMKAQRVLNKESK